VISGEYFDRTNKLFQNGHFSFHTSSKGYLVSRKENPVLNSK